MTPRLLVAMSELRTAIRRPDADLDTALQRFAEAILAHPPADAECGQRAPRDAAPAAAPVLPPGTWDEERVRKFNETQLAGMVDIKAKPTPPPAAPQPSEAARASDCPWRRSQELQQAERTEAAHRPRGGAGGVT